MSSSENLEDYFEFLSPDDIRIKGHRIGIDNVLDDYLVGYTPEEILIEFPSLNLEKIHTTIIYYLHHQAELDVYLLRLAKWRKQRYQESAANPSDLIQRLRTLQAHTKEQESYL